MATLTASSSSKGLTYLCSLLVRSVNVSLSSSFFTTFFYLEKSFSIGALVTETVYLRRWGRVHEIERCEMLGERDRRAG